MTYDENSARDKETEMAKIFGFEIKSVKSFKSHDGYPIFQGNVYFKGKKIGSWSQDDWGGPDRFDFDVTPYEKALQDVDISSHPQFDQLREYDLPLSMDILMEEIINLQNDEKAYKNVIRRGYPNVVKCDDGYGACFIGMKNDEAELTDAYKASIARKIGCKVSDMKVTCCHASDFTIGRAVSIGA